MQRLILIFIAMILMSGLLFSQEIDPEEFKIEKNQLEEKRADLLKEKESLRKEISDMYKQIEEIEIAIADALPNFLIKKYGKKNGGNLALGKVWKGMTQQMMLDAWGEPDKKHTDKFSYGVFTQYYYGKITYFFRDGKLIDQEEVE